MAGMDHLARARSVIEMETEGLRRMAERLDVNLVKEVCILHRTLDQKGKINFVGVGKAVYIGKKIVATL